MTVPTKQLTLKVVSEPNPVEWRETLQSLLASKEGYQGLFAHLIRGIEQRCFFDEFFERQPVHFSRNLSPQNTAAVNSSSSSSSSNNKKKRKSHEADDALLFSQGALLSIVQQHGLHASNNLTITKYMNKQRIDRAPDGGDADDEEEGGPSVPIAREALVSAFKAGFTVQFYQPQRFADSLYKINAGFEHVFGTLAGASAYLTPPRSQGLEPHHDDVEVFVLQTEGSKRWNLYLDASASLPEVYAKNLPQERLRGKVQVLLREGDVLYLPRGAIHEALAEAEFSTHVTISIYQNHSHKTLLKVMLPALCDELFSREERFRRGLPVRMQETFGTFVALQQQQQQQQQPCDGKYSTKDKEEAREAMLNKMRRFAASLADLVTFETLDAAADDVAADFVENRLPPPDCSAVSSPSFLPPATSGRKWGERGSRVRLVDAASMHAQVEVEEGVEVIALYNAGANDRKRHMGHPPGPEEDGDEGEEEAEGEGGGEEEDDPSARLPLSYGPIISALQLQPTCFVTSKELLGAVRGLDLYEGDVDAALQALGKKGFLVSTF